MTDFGLTPLTEAFVEIGAALILESDPPKVRSALDGIPIERLVSTALDVQGELTARLTSDLFNILSDELDTSGCVWGQRPGLVREAAARVVVAWEKAEREAARREAREVVEANKRPGRERLRWHRRVKHAVLQVYVDSDTDPEPEPPEEATRETQQAYYTKLRTAFDALVEAHQHAWMLSGAGLEQYGAVPMGEHSDKLHDIQHTLLELMHEEDPDGLDP